MEKPPVHRSFYFIISTENVNDSANSVIMYDANGTSSPVQKMASPYMERWKTDQGLENHYVSDLTLHKIDGGSGHSIRIPGSFIHHETQIRTLHIVRNVFALTERIPLE